MIIVAHCVIVLGLSKARRLPSRLFVRGVLVTHLRIVKGLIEIVVFVLLDAAFNLGTELIVIEVHVYSWVVVVYHAYLRRSLHSLDRVGIFNWLLTSMFVEGVELILIFDRSALFSCNGNLGCVQAIHCRNASILEIFIFQIGRILKTASSVESITHYAMLNICSLWRLNPVIKILVVTVFLSLE